jgi:hypothetical protein
MQAEQQMLVSLSHSNATAKMLAKYKAKLKVQIKKRNLIQTSISLSKKYFLKILKLKGVIYNNNDFSHPKMKTWLVFQLKEYTRKQNYEKVKKYTDTL